MDRNSFCIPHLGQFDAKWDNEEEFLSCFSSLAACGSIKYHNWEKDFPHRFPNYPINQHVEFRMGYSDTRLYVYWHMLSDGLRALHAEDLSPVAQDHCMEFFVQLPGEKEFWNFELNALGTLNASHRMERPHPTRLSPEQLHSVSRRGSHTGCPPFEIKNEPTAWWVAIAIPWSLLGVKPGALPTFLLGNLYACAGDIAHPYYISCFPITTPRPDFHRPEFFGTINLLHS